ncbi:GntR family transcriptional regulator [Pseudooceanicola sediminis]|uniref:GntR family transcriptional regulator n=1 Tax=Pseudooceanicola sediminis TaxID=2211117 RepID=A0A399J3F5_9RHOB|nr:GntR family transcriptional regulator [Pseudooceanicola sediminis]KAA2313321.1 GntR family transcriptional regulator [Puniceibacterium sp. HSS470]RII38442.1 GntR family transcriptional regulator [Pseudooceanicola sediminis]|tara:strand:+ start:30338 stop:31039 length:702 start_codon:yes stop_codon:yes gene_type:complete
MNLQAARQGGGGARQGATGDAGAAAGLPAHEVVYRDLRARVLHGVLAPGQAVTIQGLTQDLGAGMTPVREALRRLMAEGALEFRGNRRISVPVLTASDVEQLRHARLALEPDLARRACLTARPQDIAALQAIDAKLDEAIRRGNVHGYLVENHHFHAHLNALAGAPILWGLVEGLWLRFGPSLRVVCGQFGTRNLPDMHKDLIDAMKMGNAEAAAMAMAGDVEQGMEMIAQAL